MTLSEMLLDLSARIGSTPEVTNAQMTVWLNEAMRVFCREDDFHWLEKRVTSSTFADQDEYESPDDFWKGIELQIDSTDQDPAVYRFVPYEQRHGVEPGDKVFTQINDIIIVDPTPETTGSSNIELSYLRNPTNMVDVGDSPSDTAIAHMPEVYHPALVLYAFGIYNTYDEEHAEAEAIFGTANSPRPGTYQWFVNLAKKDNEKQKRGERRKMLTKQAAVGYTKPNQIGRVSQVLKI